MWVLSLDQEDALEESMGTTPVFLLEESHGHEEPGGPQSIGLQRIV